MQPEVLQLLKQLMADSRDDLALAQSPLLRQRPVGERAALLEQRALRRRGMAKQSRAESMLFTALGLMQMTAEPLAAAKAHRFQERGIGDVADLCCGLGGDSMHLPPAIRVTGVDRDAATLVAYRHNVGLIREARVVQADVNHLPLRVEACLIDPARRPKGEVKNWGSSELMPTLEQLERLREKQPNLAIKLGPGLDLPESLIDAECEYLGLRDSCLELMLWCGSLGDRDLVRATEWPSGATIAAPRRDRDESFADLGEESVGEPNTYFYEPVKCVVRAHLHAILASQLGLKLMDPRIAYLTGTHPIEHALLKRYALVREMPNDPAEIKAVFKKEEVGEVTVKKRGVPIIPEKIRAATRCPGGRHAATLIFTRLGDKRRVFWVKPERLAGSLSDGESGLSDDETVADG